MVDNHLKATPLVDIAGKHKPFPEDLFQLAKTLAR